MKLSWGRRRDGTCRMGIAGDYLPRACSGSQPARIRRNATRKMKKVAAAYSVLKECPQEQDFTTLGLFILKPEPIRLSI